MVDDTLLEQPTNAAAEPQEEHWGLGGEGSQNKNEGEEKDDVVADTFDWAYKNMKSTSLCLKKKKETVLFFSKS